MKISILCFDLSDNSLGRAALLARAVARNHEVELIGPSKQEKVWFPLKDLEFPIKMFPWRRYPGFAPVLSRMVAAIDGDIVIASKLRPTSFGVGLLKKMKAGVPLIVDIDDWELGFYYRSDFWGRLGRFLNLSNPNGLPYTWLMEKMVRFADGITVSNRFLQNRFSGTILHHCRDTSLLDPAKFDSEKSKKSLGLSGKKVVMFLGTPRAHKGVEDLFSALEEIKDRDVRLGIVGADDRFESTMQRWKGIADRVSLFPPISFSSLPEYLAAADVVAIPQRKTMDTVGQMPAKIFDAMAMAKPVVSTRVSDIPEVLGDCGYLVEPGSPRQLAGKINHIFNSPKDAAEKGMKARERCMELFDIRVMESGILKIIEEVSSKFRL